MHNNQCDQIAEMNLFHSPRKESSWIEAPASQRHNIIASGQSEFVTALNVNNRSNDPSLWTYTGPYYIDFDSEDINETIAQFKLFLSKLVALGIELDQIYLYASGKKGFHIEIPQEMFISKPSSAGYRSLPAIYKEMSYAMYVDTLDLAVYTARKGRMWRTPNFKRPGTGTFKVQITAAEAMAMTEEYYRQVVAVPRPLFALLPPKINTALELEWSKARDKVVSAVKKRKATGQVEAKLKRRLAAVGYVFPPSLLDVAMGKSPTKAGFQQIATQLAITANALDVGKQQFLDLCSGLVANHVGDGTRYRSQAARKKELARMWHYMEGNPSYSFSVGAIRSILPKNAACHDLRGL